MNRRRIAFLACIAVASLSIGGSAIAQLPPLTSIEVSDLPTVMPAVPPGGYPPTVAPTAAAPYLAPPAWGQTLPANVRFVILSNFGSDAVLDRETGLVWSRRTVAPEVTESSADALCRSLGMGNRMGWRLPAIAELQSLLDLSVPVTSEPRLPVGHPFLLSPLVTLQLYWASDTFPLSTGPARMRVRLDTGASGLATQNRSALLCVRGAAEAGHT